jgi:hypothetical protein
MSNVTEMYELLRTSIIENTPKGELKPALDQLRASVRTSEALKAVPVYGEWTHPTTGEVRHYIRNINAVFGFNWATGEEALLTDTVNYRYGKAVKQWLKDSKPFVNVEGELKWGRTVALPQDLRHGFGSQLVEIEAHAQEIITRHNS